MQDNEELQESEITYEEEPRSNWVELLSFIKTLAVLIVAVLFVRASIVEAFKIPSLSMFPTLKERDHILVGKLSYGLWLPFTKTMLFQWSLPDRRDIVVFTRPDIPATPEDESSINIIKRVVGLPGDVVEVSGNRVFVDNQVLEEPYAVWDEGGNRDFGPVKVPPDHVFLMGDNRDHSKDSRFWEDSPFLDSRRIKGRALIIYWNITDLGRMGKVVR